MTDAKNEYNLCCAECAVLREVVPGEELQFDMLEVESLGSFLLLHRGHAMIFVSKE